MAHAWTRHLAAKFMSEKNYKPRAELIENFIFPGLFFDASNTIEKSFFFQFFEPNIQFFIRIKTVKINFHFIKKNIFRHSFNWLKAKHSTTHVYTHFCMSSTIWNEYKKCLTNIWTPTRYPLAYNNKQHSNAFLNEW